ncbi:MAG: hypothetical protein CMP15_06195 [Rickettsiales bacterium]|nr:hypothetical protein [Rickettsiales bacterium]|tara:strand:+ start:2241 stop:2537 length:297 start_codon:yes stop_codon:yes gene_type:complete
MKEEYITLLLQGALKDPILWILSFVIGSGLLVKKLKNIYLYLFIGGLLWGFIRLYIYKALGEILTINQSSQLIFISILLMILFGIFFYFIINLIKTKD